MAVLWTLNRSSGSAPLAGATSTAGDNNLGVVVNRSLVSGAGPSGGNTYRFQFLYSAARNNAGSAYGGEFYLGWFTDVGTAPATGASRFSRIYFYVDPASNFRAINSSSGASSQIIHKLWILADDGISAGRTIVSLHGDGTGGFGLQIGKNGEGNIHIDGLSGGQWYALQVETKTGLSGSAYLKAWLNNDIYASPTGSATGLSMVATYYDWVSLGFYNNRMLASDGVYTIDYGGFEYADTFDASWYTSMTGGGGSTPLFTSASSAIGTVGTAGTFSVTTSGGATSITRSGSLPSGVTYTDHGNGTATLSGTPGAGQGGSYPLTFTATNGSGSTSQSFTLTIRQAPAVTSASSGTFTRGVSGSFTVTTSGYLPPSISRGGVALPAGLTFTDNGNGTGTLSGTPTGTAGTYAITFTATNVTGSSAAQAFTLTLRQVPAITSASSATGAVGSAGTFTITTTGFPTPTLSRTGTLPTGVTFTDNGNGTATLAGTPTTSGTYPLTFTATNAAGATPQSFTLTITATGAPVVTSAAATTFAVGSPGTFTVTTSGTPTATTIGQTGTLPTGVTFTNNGDGTATLAGTPAAATGETYPLTITADNGVGATPQTFILTVTQLPVITSSASTSFTVSAAGTFTATSTGYPAPTFTTSGVLPAGVTLTSNGDGTATLAGTPGFATSGTYPFTLTATNSTGSDPQSFTLTVLGTGSAPSFTSAASDTFTVGVADSFTVTTSGTVATITRTGAALPTGVTFTDNLDGTATLAGTAAATTGGTYAYVLTASGSSGSTPQTFTFTVNEAPAFESSTSDTFASGEPQTFTVEASGVPTPTLGSSGTLPVGVTFTDNGDGTATLAGTTSDTGAFPLTFTATNVVAATPQSFTLTVDASALPNTNEVNATVITSLPYSVTQTVHVAGTTYSVWYTYTPSVDQVVSLFAYGAATGYTPLVNVMINGGLDVYNSIFNYPQKPIVMALDAGVQYWFWIVTPGGNPSPAELSLTLEAFTDGDVPTGSIFINDAAGGFPGAFLSGSNGQPVSYEHTFPGGEQMAQLVDGTLLVQDVTALNYQLYTASLAPIATVARYTGVTISSNRTTLFYLGHGATAAVPGLIETVSPTGTVGATTWTVSGTGPAAIAPTRDDTILYYADGTSGGTIDRWDLINDVTLSDLAAGVAGYRVRELFVLGDGTVLALYDEVAGNDVYVVRYSAAGATLNTYSTQFDDSTGSDTHLALSNTDPTSFWAWIKLADGLSRFMQITTSSGTITSTFEAYHFTSGLYDGATSATPEARFGHSESCTFVVTVGAVAPGSSEYVRTPRRLRRAPHLSQENTIVFYSQFQLDLEAGLGLVDGQGDDPTIMLRWSDDGGHTWSNIHTVSAGAMGRYGHRAIWRRLGRGRDRIFEVTVSDPVRWHLLGAFLQLQGGTS